MQFTKGHAVVIGVGTYQHMPERDVPLTADDASEVAAVLQDQRYCGYPQQQVHLLTKDQATRENILEALDSLATMSAEDTVVVFFSGHGEYGTDGYYLTTHDTKMVNGKVVEGTGVRETELLERLRQLPAQRALLIFNACHSGELMPPSLGDTAATPSSAGHNLPDDVAVAMLGTGQGRVIMTACRENQQSYFVKTQPMTLFADALADGLRGKGITSRHGYISVFDLYDHVFSRTNTYVKDTWGLDQEPMLTINRGVGVMAVALYRGAEPTAEALDMAPPSSLGSAVREVDPAESQQRLQQILSGKINLAAGRDMTGNTNVHGNQNTNTGSGTQNNVGKDHVSVGSGIGSIGNLNTGGGPVISGGVNVSGGEFVGRDKRVYGDEVHGNKIGTQRNINTSGGDYSEGTIDKRQGAFVSGGMVYGPVTGTNTGSITTSYNGLPASTAAPTPLQQALTNVQQAQQAAARRGDDELADDLKGVVGSLESAVKAQEQGNTQRRTMKLREAAITIRNLVVNGATLDELAHQVERLT